MKNTGIYSQEDIENRIITLRNVQVMLDKDLAKIFRVKTKVLNQAVRRNLARFPENFRFKLEKSEIKEAMEIISSNLRSQIVTSSLSLKIDDYETHGGSRYPHYAFTEQGVAMLSAILRSEIAIKVSIEVMNAFAEMRKLFYQYGSILKRIEGLEYMQIQNDKKFIQVFNALEKKNELPLQGVFFNDTVFDAYGLASKIIRSAEKNITLIDNYVNEETLVLLTKKKENVKVTILTSNINEQILLDLKRVNEQYANFSIIHFSKSHDRFLILDSTEVYHIGASLKDLGKKWFAFTKLDRTSVENIIHSIQLWL